MTEKPKKDEAPFLRIMGVKPDFLPDEESPPVDEMKIEKLLAGELPGCEALEVEMAIQSFRPWYKAWCRGIARRAKD